jgi:hypothetical protein
VDYPFSSERAYTGERATIPFDAIGLKTALERKGLFGLQGYREFMDQDETPYVANLFERGSPLDPRIVGNRVFVQQARQMAAHPSAPPSREQLIAGVARLMNKTPADILSATRTGMLGRSLVAWYGQRTGAATLTEMGRWLGVTGATLGQTMRHHRYVWPDLFNQPVLLGNEASERE